MSKTVNLGRVVGKSAYEQAKEGGYAGTEAEFNTLMANPMTAEKVDERVNTYLDKSELLLQAVKNEMYEIDITNLYDKSTAKNGYTVQSWDMSTLTVENYQCASSGKFCSAPIEVTEGVTYYFYCKNYNWNAVNAVTVQIVMYFDENGNYLSNESGKKQTTAPSGAKYMAFSYNQISYINSFMVTDREYSSEMYKEYKETHKKDEHVPYVIMDFDHFAYDNRFTIMESYGFPFTIALSAENTTKITKEIYQEMIDNDIDVSLYIPVASFEHDLYDAEYQDYFNELVANDLKTSMNDKGFYYPVMYSCSQGKLSDVLTNASLKNGFRLIRGNTFYDSTGSSSIVAKSDCDYLFSDYEQKIRFFNITNNSNYPKRLVDLAIANKKNLCFFTHTVSTTDTADDKYSTTESIFTEVLEYLKEKQDLGQIKIVNAKQYHRLINPLDSAKVDEQRAIKRALYEMQTTE